MPFVGLVWAFSFVFLESLQFVFFGGLFQRMNSYLFGACVFALSTVLFICWSWLWRREELSLALSNVPLIIKINITATLAWIAFLGSVQFIEPAVAYTIGSGAMPLTVLVLYWMRLPGGTPLSNQVEAAGLWTVAAALLVLSAVTVSGNSGFAVNAPLGVFLAIADGIFFTLLLVYCGQLSQLGVGAGTVFGLRFPLYVLVAAMLFALDFGPPNSTDWNESIWFVIVGFALIVPPLYALQRAVDLVSTLTLSLMIATGPLIIFVLQIFEGRVLQSGLTLAGLMIYFLGALLSAFGNFRSNSNTHA